MPVATTTTRPSRLSHPSASSNAAAPSSPDRKKSTKKENQFNLRAASKLHAYTRDKAPYPYSYNKDILQWSCIDHNFMYQLHRSLSWINFKQDTPKRCLDLGTGLGDWCIDAARQWKDCTFVGYDLVNVQIPLTAVDSDIAERIEWVHGNFLRQKLPFEDEEFDHVHIQGLAFAVPENKWHSLYEEVHRVLRPGGTVEVIEDDAIFPVLPKWFTTPLHTPVPHDVNDENPELEETPPSRSLYLPSPEHLSHAHALLEALFYAVFHNRFLNPTPSSMLPGYFSAFFSHVLSPPIMNFAMPPIAPLRPRPPLPLSGPRTEDIPRPGVTASTDSDSPRSSASDPFSDSANDSVLTSLNHSTSMSSLSSVESTSPSRRSHLFSYLHEESTMISGSKAIEIFSVCDSALFREHALYMQLQRAVAMVLSLKEAMWEELKEIIRDDRQYLRNFGWEESDFDHSDGAARDYGASRMKFDSMVEQYKSDMHKRISLWYMMTKNGWQLPRRNVLSKAETILDQRMRKAVEEAQKHTDGEELARPCRSMRLLVGVKAVS